MVNYQLYRTNVFLSGQVKWDLIIDNVDNELEIKEFQLTPISEKINFRREESDYWLSHSHQDNLKKLYNNISGDFYNHLLDLSLTNDMPFYSKKKQYNDDYIMGCKRMLYSIYGKQFQFFCPVWLEHVSSPISFFIDIYTKSNTLLYRRELKLDYKGKKGHDSFVKYFNDYINYVGLKEGNDKICNIDFKNDACMYDGVSAKYGLKQRLNQKYMLNQLKDRERPLMMTDNMIIDVFKSNKLISKQLFNFNLCFNIIDILPNHLKNMMMGDLLNVKVKVSIGGEEIGLRDFYSNYDFIKRNKCDFKRVYGLNVNKEPESQQNVLDYLQDDKIADLAYENKLVQDTIHWCLLDNEDYIFNLYDGFAGYSETLDDLGNTIINNHTKLYQDTPDLIYKKYQQSFNNINWVNTYKIQNDFINTYMIHIFEHIKISSGWTYVDENIKWIKNIKYNTNNIPPMEIVNVLIEGYNMNDIGEAILGNVIGNGMVNEGSLLPLKNSLYIVNFGTTDYFRYMIYSDDPDMLTFATVFQTLRDLSTQANPWMIDNYDVSWLKNLYDFMRSAVPSINPYAITIKNSLYIDKVDSPSFNSQEVMYYKRDNESYTLLRYSGELKPLFISCDDERYNMFYNKRIIENKLLIDNFNVLLNTSYKSIYPSIGYYALEKKKVDYKNIDEMGIYKEFETKWYNDSLCYLLEKEFEFQVNSLTVDGKYVEVGELVKQYLKNYYNISDDDLLNNIYNLYRFESTYDYEYEEDGRTVKLDENKMIKYIYNIKITLK